MCNMIVSRGKSINYSSYTFCRLASYFCRFPYDAKAVQDIPGVLPADLRGRADRGSSPEHAQRPRSAPDSRHLLPVHAASYHPGCGIFHAEPTILRSFRNHFVVRCCWDCLQYFDDW